MKHLKIYEDFDERFKIGDIVIVINAYRSGGANFKNGDICRVENIEDDSYILIRNEKGSEEYLKSRVIPESEYLAKKFNI